MVTPVAILMFLPSLASGLIIIRPRCPIYKPSPILVLAGICAFSYDGNTYSECKNTGKISVTAAKAGTGYLSGIVGYLGDLGLHIHICLNDIYILQ